MELEVSCKAFLVCTGKSAAGRWLRLMRSRRAGLAWRGVYLFRCAMTPYPGDCMWDEVKVKTKLAEMHKDSEPTGIGSAARWSREQVSFSFLPLTIRSFSSCLNCTIARGRFSQWRVSLAKRVSPGTPNQSSIQPASLNLHIRISTRDFYQMSGNM